MNIRRHNKIIIAGLVGNLVESFDMSACGLLSVFFAKYLTGNTKSSLLFILATFFLGFLARPIGAIVLGLCSDRYGRKKTLAASIIMMGVSTALIGLIPSYNVIGLWAVFCLLGLRIIQNFSCGAEFLNSSSFLIESSDHKYRGYFGSWASFGSMGGVMIASILLVGIINWGKTYPNFDWILWRIPFVFALLGSCVGLYVRSSIPESREYIFHYANNQQPKFSQLLKLSFAYMVAHKIKSLSVFVLSSLGVSITFLIYICPSIEVNIYNQFSIIEILSSNIISLGVMLTIFPFMGKLSDKLNRNYLIRVSSVTLLVFLYPFLYILGTGTFYQLILIQVVIAFPAAAYYASVPVFLAEIYPINLRCTILSSIYSVAASIAGGLVPILSVYLIKSTLTPTSPILIIITLVSLTLMLLHIQKKQLPLPQEPALTPTNLNDKSYFLQ